MSNLTPSAAWSDVYKIELTDWIDASKTGVSNAQAQALLNRLQFLYNKFNTLLTKMNSYDDPIGTIKLWFSSLANLPAGWQLCDGTNGTPDLRNRYAKCAENNTTLGYKSGQSTFSFQFNIYEYNSHLHEGTISYAPTHEHSVNIGAANGYLGDNLKWGNYGSYAANGHTHPPSYIHYYDSDRTTHRHFIYVSTAGVHSHIVSFANVNNMPASVAIYYVMKIS